MILLNGKPINVTMFPDKTSQVWKLPEYIVEITNYCRVTWEFEHEGEFMHLAQLKLLLDSYNIHSDLMLKYLPYGRQDKPVSNNTTFALTTFASLLNFLQFEIVFIHDPHSNVAATLINDSVTRYPLTELGKVVELTTTDVVCYPDAGAVSKYSVKYPFKYIYGNKVRNQETGDIISYELVGDASHTDFYGKNVLIVDDICDGGMTFKLLAKDLLAGGAKEVNLFVSHGVFSKGLKTLHDSNIKRVFTKDGEAKEIDGKIIYASL